jgi:hypothetical protein
VGKNAVAFTLLKRVLELGYQQLNGDVLHEVFLTLAMIAYKDQEYEFAARFAETSLEIDGPDTAVDLRLLALSHLEMGEHQIQSGLKVTTLQPSDMETTLDQLSVGLDQIQQGSQHFQQASQYLNRLIQLKDLNPKTLAEARVIQARCETLLGNVPTGQVNVKPSAGAALETLLEAEDIPAALQQHPEWLDTELIDLIRQNATTARKDNDPDLAEGLEVLADYIEDFLTVQFYTF